MKKKVVSVLLCMFLLCNLFGCAEIVEKASIGKGVVTESIEVWLDKPVTDIMLEEMAGKLDLDAQGFSVIKRNSAEYYYLKKNLTYTYDEIWQQQYQIITDTSLYAPQSNIVDYMKEYGIKDAEKWVDLIRVMRIDVEFETPVKESNGAIDGNKVSFDLLNEANQTEIYAYCEGAENTLVADRATFLQRFNSEQKYPYKKTVKVKGGTLWFQGNVTGDRQTLILDKVTLKLAKGFKIVTSKKNKIKKNGKVVKKWQKLYNSKKKEFVFKDKGKWTLSLVLKQKKKTYKFSLSEPIVIKTDLKGNWQ